MKTTREDVRNIAIIANTATIVTAVKIATTLLFILFSSFLFSP